MLKYVAFCVFHYSRELSLSLEECVMGSPAKNIEGNMESTKTPEKKNKVAVEKKTTPTKRKLEFDIWNPTPKESKFVSKSEADDLGTNIKSLTPAQE